MAFGALFRQRFVDVSKAPISIEPAAGGPGDRIHILGPESNVSRFRRAITEPIAMGTPPLHTYERGNALVTTVQGGILFLPPGRYLVENERPDCWQRNLWTSVGESPANYLALWSNERFDNPFGASLHIPKDVTLWMAPGAVLVPARNAIIAIEGPLVCEPVQIFDLSLVDDPSKQGVVVFGTRVPRLLPQWWGDDHAAAIQAAIDAGIRNRSMVWEYPDTTAKTPVYKSHAFTLPNIPVELRGDYRLRRTVTVPGAARTNRLLDILGRDAVSALMLSDHDRNLQLAPATVPHGAEGVVVAASYDDPTAFATHVEVSPARVVLVTPEFGGYALHITPHRDARRGERADIVVDLSNRMQLRFSVTIEDTPHARREIPYITPNTVIDGAPIGRAGRGARLISDAAFLLSQQVGENSLLRLENAMGLTLRNVEFDVTAVPDMTCVDAVQLVPLRQMQGAAIRNCTFRGSGERSRLVRLGPLPREVVPGNPPTALPSNYETDMSAFDIDRCEFRPMGGGVAVTIRSGQALPIRIRNCDFVGEAQAMIVMWEGSLQLDGCRFENNPHLPKQLTPPVRGFEDPDGADIYLANEPPWRVPNPAMPTALPLAYTGGITATGCVSLSPRFLSSASPRPGNFQQQVWPVLLFNVRHLPTTPVAGVASVRWGRMNEASNVLVVRVGERKMSTLNAGSSLVILGGQYAGQFHALRGSLYSVVVGARDLERGLMPIELPDAYPEATRVPWPVLEVFGLYVDSRVRHL